MEKYLPFITLFLVIALFVLIIFLLIRQSRILKNMRDRKNIADDISGDIRTQTQGIKNDILNEIKSVRIETVNTVNDSVRDMKNDIREDQKNSFENQINRQNDIGKSLETLLDSKIKSFSESTDLRLGEMRSQIRSFSEESKQSLEKTERSVSENLSDIRKENSEKLEKIRETVEEKLQKTLDDKLAQSFNIVSENIKYVSESVGEMKTLAGEVGDLKKVMSGVKTRGILGEVQLGAIIREILSPSQYRENVPTRPNSRDRVEFAVKFPGASDDRECLLPIDAKFPADTYEHLLVAYDTADKNQIDDAKKALITRIRGEAKDIKEKYIEPPFTTRFGIMFLPFEGLYAEVVQTPGLMEELQRDYNITVAGPTTLSALLNSFQMGFQTLAIQKRSGEIEKVLGAVKTEFGKFGVTLAKLQKNLNDSSKELDNLVGVRSRQIERSLKSVTEVSDSESSVLLDDDSDSADSDDTVTS
ncbi:MAG: DNA recombination protein RmuC [Clostridia bacterium]|nr:DNA recombination protein RmuC [Clostridia bacterium]